MSEFPAESQSSVPAKPSRRPRTLQDFAVLAAVGMLLLIGTLEWLIMRSAAEGAFARLVGMGLYLVGSTLAFVHLGRHYTYPVLGWGNVVTLLRFALVCLIAAALCLTGLSPWVVFALACLTLALDGLDGWLARRDDLVSDFGARFDMETDAVFALILALGAFTSGVVGAEVLCLGIARYVFWLASLQWTWLNGRLPERFGRKVICVLQIGTLVALLAPTLPPGIAQGATLAVIAALIASFGRDIWWLWKRRAHADEA